MRTLILLALLSLCVASDAFDGSGSSGEGEFLSPRQDVGGTSTTFSLSKFQSLGLNIHFRRSENSQWCCAYAILRSGRKPSMACLTILQGDVSNLGHRTIAYRYSLNDGRVKLSFRTIEGDTIMARVNSKFGSTGPSEFTIDLPDADPVVHSSADGKTFFVSNVGKSTTIRQIKRMPDSESEQDILRFVQEVVAGNADAEKAEP